MPDHDPVLESHYKALAGVLLQKDIPLRVGHVLLTKWLIRAARALYKKRVLVKRYTGLDYKTISKYGDPWD